MWKLIDRIINRFRNRSQEQETKETKCLQKSIPLKKRACFISSLYDLRKMLVVETTIHAMDFSTCVRFPILTAPENLPSIRSGSYADIGPRISMDDRHIAIDDLSAHLRAHVSFPGPSAFYGVFDGHEGPEAAAYVRDNVIRLFFEGDNFPQAPKVNVAFLEQVQNSLRRGFLLADAALANDRNASGSCGTTALTALILGRILTVANVGDCRAVLCRRGEAVELSHDHRPSHSPERRRVEAVGGFIIDGYLNGELAVTRALGDWDMKRALGVESPLIGEPEFRHVALMKEDEFLVMGCDGIWDEVSSQEAVSLVRRGLRRHNNPEQCARDLAREALRRESFDNLTVIVVCFTPLDSVGLPSTVVMRRLTTFGRLRSLLWGI